MPRDAAKPKAVAFAELDRNDPFDGLTSKQQQFVSYSFSGLSDVEAYRQAFDCSQMTESTIWRRSADTSHNPLIRAKLRQLVDTRDASATLSPLLSREWIANGIVNIARAGDKDSTRLRAFELLGKMAGIDMFRDITVHEKTTRTVEDVETDLKEKLDTLRNSLTIEGKALSVSDDSGNPLPKDRRRKPTPNK